MNSSSTSVEMGQATHVNKSSICSVYMHQYTTKVFFTVFYSIIFVIGSCANSLVFYVATQKLQKVNSSSLYLINLATADALFTLALPGRIAYYALGFNWPFGKAFCRITAFIFYMNTYTSIHLTTCLSINRYMAVVCPHRFRKFRSIKTGKYVCAFIWFLVLCLTAPLLFQPMLIEINGKLTCMEFTSFEGKRSLPAFVLIGIAVSYCVPLALVSVCYLQINLKLWKSVKENPVASKMQHKKATTIIFLVLLGFVICVSPYHINIMQFMIRKIFHQPSCWDQKVFKMSLQVTVSLMNLNCCIDPAIYFFALKGYRAKVQSLLKRNCS
uniref:Si:ch211-184m13.4 n=1 Tax=Latimeria chalumnae TaxID=7897 RepID=H3A5K7_LATCH